MTNFYLAAGYLANPKRQLLIEAEVVSRLMPSFPTKYHSLTGNTINPADLNYVHNVGGNKFGIEWRSYYVNDGAIPVDLVDISYPNTRRDKPAYTHRCDQGRNFVKPLLRIGFVIGATQNIIRIRTLVPHAHLADFDAGYSI